jgi:WD40 repeat protein
VAADGKTIKLWSASGPRDGVTLGSHTKEFVYRGVWGPDGRLLATGGYDDLVRIWDVEAGREVRSLRGHEDHIVSVAFSPDGKQIASGGYDRSIRVWDVATGRLDRTLRGHVGAVWCVAFSPDGTHLASGSGRVGSGSVGNTYFSELKVWDLSTGAATDLTGHTAMVADVAWSPDGTRLASAGMGRDGNVRLWDAATLTCVGTFRGNEEGLSRVAFSPDGRRVAALGFDQLARIWDVRSGSQVRALSGLGSTAGPRFLAFSPGGRHLLANAGSQLLVWDTTQDEPASEAGAHRQPAQGQGPVTDATAPVPPPVVAGAVDASNPWPDAAKPEGLRFGDSNSLLAFSPDLRQGGRGGRRSTHGKGLDGPPRRDGRHPREP